MKPIVSTSAALLVAGVSVLIAQDRLKLMPGYDQYSRMAPQLQNAFVSNAVQGVRWADDGRSFTYAVAGDRFSFDLASMTSTPLASAPTPAPAAGGRGVGRQGGAPPAARGGLEQEQTEMPAAPMNGCPQIGPARGRQDECVLSPDGTLKAFYRGRNFWVANADGSNEIQVTTDGSVAGRIKNGSGSWVYGEELGQTTAIWWAPDSSRVGYYRFDESQVADFFIAMNQTGVQTVVDTEAYPKAGTPNPIADVFVFDVKGRASTRIDVRDGKPFTNDVVGHYAYNVRWSPDGSELLLNRTNRRQQIMEFVACAPATGKCRVVVREEWLTGWTDNRPGLTWLADQKRFIWESDRNGWTNYYLYDISGRLLNPITAHTTFEAGPIVKVDERRGVMFYMARDGDNHMKMQLHRVGLDGKGDVRLTDPRSTHAIVACTPRAGADGAAGSCGISPDNQYFIDTFQTHDRAPATQVVRIDAAGASTRAVEIAKADVSRLDALHVRRAEQFTYLAADRNTKLFGQMQFPSNFDPSKKWPVLVSVYGGPGSASNVPTETFAPSAPLAEYGFIIVSLSSRAAPGMGKKVIDSVYLKLGVTEIDDMAEGIKALASHPFVDAKRIGIYGTSYGGYTAATMILRYPDLVAAASASSPPTSWYHYDSIYTERYMWIPQENKAGYEAGNDLNFARDLKGRLLLYYGTADNNVHPNNTMQLIKALQAAGKSFELQVGPDQGHSGVNSQRMMEFFIENLVMRPERATGA
ncbi:MAG TPA: DPP IV N-terminal domain-containing protein [Vicinamibacterales bacterium]|nr:DPP IV N-terminal domain-containing protein [Vicinamibacterales bacterium]